MPDEGHFETVAGFVIEQLGRLAEVGDTVAIEQGDFRVERLDGRRIERIRFTPTVRPSEVDLL